MLSLCDLRGEKGVNKPDVTSVAWKELLLDPIA